ncbi:MAG: EAL domain-containing protein [Terriglobales bacterium]
MAEDTEQIGGAFSERKPALDALGESEQSFRKLVEALPDAILVHSEDRIVFVNPSCMRLLGAERPDQLVGKAISEIIHPDSLPTIRRRIQDCYDRRTTNPPMENFLVTLNGSSVPTEAAAIFITWKGSPAIEVILRDISERKRAEQALHGWQKRLELAQKAGLRIGLWDWDVTANTVIWSDESYRQFGYTRDTFSGRVEDAVTRLHPEDLPRVEGAIRNVLEGGPEYAAQYRVVRPDGSTCWIDAHGVMVRDGSTHMLGVGVDITDVKKAEQSLQESEEKYLLLLNSTAEAIYGLDLSGNCTFCNPACARLLGYQAPEDLLGRNMHALMHHTRVNGTPYPEQDCEIYVAVREGRASHVTDEVLWRADRTSFSVEYWSYPMYKAGELVGAVVTFLDISDRKQAEDALRHAEQKYRGIFEEAVVGIWQTTPDGRYLSVNPAMAHMFGYNSPQELMASVTNIDQQVYVDPTRREDFKRLVDAQGFVRNFEVQAYRKDGDKMWLSANAKAVRSSGVAVRYDGTIEDITNRKVLEGRVQFLAYYDALTGLPNRTLLQDRLSKALASARRHREKVALVFLDLDRFKTINDSLGHSVGDLFLKEVAERLKKWAREQDTVARLGGDEFVLVLTGIKDTADAAVAADRLMKTITPAFVVQEHWLSVTCSLGISVFPDHGTDGETLLKNADAAMYCAKENGNSFQFFTQEMNVQAVERLTLESSLRLALEREELFLEYQPQVDLATGKIAGAEALLRWRHPELGLVPPSKFIPIAENSGLITPIGEWVLRTACTQARQWQEEGLAPLPIAVNVSAVQFRQEQFCQVIRTVLDETGLPAQHLELEITESLLLSDADAMLSALQKLKRIGVNFSIDDFGTGYSSLSYLRRFPVYKLKIDCSFVQAMTTNPDDAAITATIINMAKTLKLKVIAEGVETEHQMLFLREHNCDEVQGYYFSRPLAAGDFAEKVRRQRRFPRHRTDLQLRVRDPLERDLEGRCGIISEGGLAVSLPEPLPVGIVVSLQFTVSTHPTPLYAMAVVRTQLGLQHGLEFVSLTEAEQVSIRQFCNELATQEACVPARRTTKKPAALPQEVVQKVKE